MAAESNCCTNRQREFAATTTRKTFGREKATFYSVTQFLLYFYSNIAVLSFDINLIGGSAVDDDKIWRVVFECSPRVNKGLYMKGKCIR